MNLDRIVNMIFRMIMRRGISAMINKTINWFSNRGAVTKDRNTQGSAHDTSPGGPWSDKNARSVRERHRTMRRR